MNELFFLLQPMLLMLEEFFRKLQQTDASVLAFITHHRMNALDPIFIQFTDIATLVTYSIPVILLLYAYLTHRFLLQRKSWLVLITLTINSAIVDTLKKVVHRPRPFVTYRNIHNLVPVNSFSFPSGHTAEVMLLAISLSMLFPKRKWAIAIAWLWALMVSYSRMDLGVHYPSDVLGSVLIGWLVAFTFINLMRRLGFLHSPTGHFQSTNKLSGFLFLHALIFFAAHSFFRDNYA